jgi:hypothetical protein
MSNLTIEQVTITDTLAERARICTAVLAPVNRVGAPGIEFRFPGDTQQLAGTNIRPNGSIINVAAGYGNVPQHTIFSGSVEVMDDLENADQYTYNIVLSEIPASQNHRIKLTLLYDLLFNQTMGGPSTSTHAVLADACAKVGIPFGRCDLPNVQCIGNYEVIRKNICEIAEELCAPFNQFDYMHYFVRVSERDGLSIIGIDYTQAGGVDNTYEVLNVEHKTRTFQRYMPDNKIGTSDILLIGADMYAVQPGWVTNPLQTNIQAAAQIPPNTFSPEPVITYSTVTHTYLSDSNQDEVADEVSGNGAWLDQDHISVTFVYHPGDAAWSETETTMEFVIRETYAPGKITIITSGELMDHVNGTQASGQISFEVVESYITKVVTRSYDKDLGGLTSISETHNYYAYTKFSEQVYKPGDLKSHVLVFTMVEVTEYIDGSAFPDTLTKEAFYYDEATGAQIRNFTASYYGDNRGNWILEKLNYDDSSSVRPVPDTNTQTFSSTAGPLTPKVASLIGKYQLLDGDSYSSVDYTRYFNPITGQPLAAKEILASQITGLVAGPIPQNLQILNLNSAPLRAIPAVAYNADLPGYDPTASEFNQQQLEKRCFQMSIPYMDYDGLLLIWAMCKKQQVLENLGVYWEIVKATASIDTTPAAGESIVAAGSSGICESVEHGITEDAAMTTLSIRRLITPEA